jgi:hypothetical protein
LSPQTFEEARMRTWMRITALAVIAIATVVLFSCSTNPVSIVDRLNDFISSLNGDRTNTYTNLDSSTSAYSLAKPASWWDTPFPVASETYSSPTTPVMTNPADVEITINGTGGFTHLYKFVMVNAGTTSDNWVINDIQVMSGVFTTIF